MSNGMPPQRMGINDLVVARISSVRNFKKGDLLRPRDAVGFGGIVHARLFDKAGVLKQHEAGYNLVTDYGDEHVGERMYNDAFDIVTGMRLGTGTTAAAKAGAGAAIVTYETGSFELLDAVASGADKGAGLGWRVTHVCTWDAGDVTEVALAEVVLSDENPLTDVAGVVGDTVARFVFPATIDKQAGDSLEVTWQVDFLGS